MRSDWILSTVKCSVFSHLPKCSRWLAVCLPIAVWMACESKRSKQEISEWGESRENPAGYMYIMYKCNIYILCIYVYKYTFCSKPVKGRQVTGHQFGRTLLLSSYFHLVFFKPYTLCQNEVYQNIRSLLILDGCPRLLVEVFPLFPLLQPGYNNRSVSQVQSSLCILCGKKKPVQSCPTWICWLTTRPLGQGILTSRVPSSDRTYQLEIPFTV